MVHELLAGELGHDVVHFGLAILDLKEAFECALIQSEVLQFFGLDVRLWLWTTLFVAEEVGAHLLSSLLATRFLCLIEAFR